ncbi:hypothetical protein OTK49_00945 [Vibrio coralliirubri]|uniref:hypothetical protein n=1 Tax=Vibrio coralliirubri TaxID=1516159 RepID=UPI0022851BC8|nr:hypothetical protein [Vibrio coralliirubri]MCY9861098.1 hypothetical protein [Vibrio coralliirubri]
MLSVMVCVSAVLAGASAWKAISRTLNPNDNSAYSLNLDADKYFVTTMVKEIVSLNEYGRPMDCPNYLLKVKEDHFFTRSDIHNIPFCKAMAYKQNLNESPEICGVFKHLKSEANYNTKAESSLSGYCN